MTMLVIKYYLITNIIIFKITVAFTDGQLQYYINTGLP